MLISKTEELQSAAARGNNNKFGRTGKPFGVFVVDIDVKDGGVATWDALCAVEAHGCNHIVHTPSGGLHLYYAYDARLDCIKSKAKTVVGGVSVGIDVRSTGGIIVLPESRSQDAFYTLQKCDGEPANVPDWLFLLLAPVVVDKKRKREAQPAPGAVAGSSVPAHLGGFPRCKSIDDVLLPYKLSICERLLDLIPTRVATDYDNWIQILFVLKNTLGEAGFALLDKKSRKDPAKYPGEDVIRAKWDGEKLGPHGMDWLYGWARECASTEDFEKKMCATHADREKVIGFDLDIVIILNNLKMEPTERQALDVKTCLRQHMRDNVALTGTNQVCVRESSWEDGSVTFRGHSAAKWFESMRRCCVKYKIEDTKCSYSAFDAVNDVREDIQYAAACFYPHGMNGEGLEKVQIHGKQGFNLFMGIKIWPKLRGKQGIKNQKNLDTVLRHVYEIMWYNGGDKQKQKECGDWFLKFLAFKLFAPYTALEKTPIFVSAVGGIGKSLFILWFIAELLGNLYGEEVTSKHGLDPKFNARARFVLLALLDDLKTVDIKSLQAAKRLRVEHKGIDAEDCPKFGDWVMNSNSFEPVVTEKGDRRNVPTECCVDFKCSTVEGDAYLKELAAAFAAPDTAEDFGFFLWELYKQDPEWNFLYSPKTSMMVAQEQRYASSPVVTTLRAYANEFGDEFVKAHGVGTSCLFKFHCILTSKKFPTAREEKLFGEEVVKILTTGRLDAAECVPDRLRHSPWFYEDTEFSEFDNAEKTVRKQVCKCTGRAKTMGYSKLTLPGLCKALRAYEHSSDHVDGCGCVINPPALVDSPPAVGPPS